MSDVSQLRRLVLACAMMGVVGMSLGVSTAEGFEPPSPALPEDRCPGLW